MPEQEVNPTDTTAQIVSGGQPERPTHWRRLAAVVLVIAVLAAAASYATYRLYQHHQAQQQAAVELKQQAAALGDNYDYATFTPDQVAIKLQAVGLSWDAAKQGDLSKLNFEQAYVVARALRTDDNYNRSLEAYKVAQSEAPANVDYTFYKGYAEVAQLANQTELWKQEMQKQKQALQNDTNIDKNFKQYSIDKIDQAIRLKDLGW